jgi:uncharacterized protein YbjT (DUF2867 family)
MAAPKKLLAIIGATGNQGFSTALTVLDSPHLSSLYSVRAISRDPNNPKMRDLAAKGASLARADLNDPSSLPTALKDAHTLFFMTATQYDGSTRAVETAQAKAVCAAALAAGVQYIIFSSMSHPYAISGGALANVDIFDAKAEIEAYIRSLPVQSAFVAPGSFMQNFSMQLRPRRAEATEGADEWVIMNCVRGDTLVPWIDVTETGKWVGAILAEPDKYEGKFFAAAAELASFDQAAKTLSRVTGKTVKYVQVPDEVFKSFLPPPIKESLCEMWVLNREYGYFGKDMHALVQWAKDQVDGELTGFEAFLRREEYALE